MNHLSKIEESSSSSFSTESSKVSSLSSFEEQKKDLKIDEMKPSMEQLNEIKIELEQFEPDISNKNVLIDLNLTIHNKFDKFNKEVRIFKCNLCSFIASTDLKEKLDLNELKKHYLRTHLAINLNENDLDYKVNN